MPAPRVLTAGSALLPLLLLALSARLLAAPPVPPPQKFRDGLPGLFLKNGPEIPVSILYLGDSPSRAEEFRTCLNKCSPDCRFTFSRFGDPLPRADLVLVEFHFHTGAAAAPAPEQVRSLAGTLWRDDPETDILFLNLPEPGAIAGSVSARSPAASQLDFFADRAGIPTLSLPSAGGGEALASCMSAISERHQKGLFPNPDETFARRRALARETAPNP